MFENKEIKVDKKLVELLIDLNMTEDKNIMFLL